MTDEYLETITTDDLHNNISSMTSGPMEQLTAFRAKGRREKKLPIKKRSFSSDDLKNYHKIELPHYIDDAIYNRYRKD